MLIAGKSMSIDSKDSENIKTNQMPKGRNKKSLPKKTWKRFRKGICWKII